MAIDSGFDRLRKEAPQVNDAPDVSADLGHQIANPEPRDGDKPAVIPAVAAIVFVALMIGAIHVTNRAVPPAKTAANLTAIESSQPAKPAPNVRIVGVPFVVAPNGQN